MEKEHILSSIMFHSFSVCLCFGFFLRIAATISYDTNDFDAYGTRLASNDYFVVLAQNNAHRFVVSVAPFGTGATCTYDYGRDSDFLLNVAVGRKQNSSQLSFIYLRTNSSGTTQHLGFFTFSLAMPSGTGSNASSSTCERHLASTDGEREVKVWERETSEMSALQVDALGRYAYGFLSKGIFIYDIARGSVQDLQWNDTFSGANIVPQGLDIGETADQVPMAVLAGYVQFDIDKTLPIVYLIQLNPPYSMTVIDSYTINSTDQKFVRGRDASTYQFNFVMSVSIHSATQRVLVGIPQLRQTFLFTFNRTNLQMVNSFNRLARSTSWLDDAGIQAGLLLSSVSTLPWAQSRVEVLNTSSNVTIYAYPNNQQTLNRWSSTAPVFIRLMTTYNNQLLVLSSDGIVVFVPSTDPGYYVESGDITDQRSMPKTCPLGTYKSQAGTTPCTVCPTGTKSSLNLNATTSPTVNCTPCLNNSFCPLAAVAEVNQSALNLISQAYAYPPAPPSTSFDDILMSNTFNLQSTPPRCLLISPFFWSLIVLSLALIVLFVMALLYHSPTGKKHFHRMQCIFRHSDLIGNGELWFGGLVSFAMIVLIVYTFLFGSLFVVKYPMETSTDANFACDPTLRNTQFSSSLQLLATIKSAEEKPIFTMLDSQMFSMTVHFIQTGYGCRDIAAQASVHSACHRSWEYLFTDFICRKILEPILSVSLRATAPRIRIMQLWCPPIPFLITKSRSKSISPVSHAFPYEELSLHLHFLGSYYIGGLFICITGPRMTSNDSSYIVQELKYCESFTSLDQTIAQSTQIYFAMTKVINQTEFLDYSGSTNFSGIWIPTSTHGALNDHISYDQRGPFLRYFSTQHTITIAFSETQFYVMNKQEPIARQGEILFHNILFTTTIIGIFALAFLVFKLTLMPIIQWCIRREACLFKRYREQLTKDRVHLRSSF